MDNYNIFIPSLQKKFLFKSLSIKQYKKILFSNNSNDFLNINFNLFFIEAIKENCLDNISLTDFDKHIIAYQLYSYSFEKEIKKEIIIEHPTVNIVHSDELYHLECRVPSVDQEIEYSQYALKKNKNDAEELLLAEITKYVCLLKINETNIDLNVDIEKKIKIIKNLPVHILAQCINYIDSVKGKIKDFYKDREFNYNAISLIP